MCPFGATSPPWREHMTKSQNSTFSSSTNTKSHMPDYPWDGSQNGKNSENPIFSQKFLKTRLQKLLVLHPIRISTPWFPKHRFQDPRTHISKDIGKLSIISRCLGLSSGQIPKFLLNSTDRNSQGEIRRTTIFSTFGQIFRELSKNLFPKSILLTLVCKNKLFWQGSNIFFLFRTNAKMCK